MNYFELVTNILQTAKKHKYIQEVYYGDIYEFENLPSRKFSNFVLTVQNNSTSTDTATYTFNAFVTDRLTDDKSNTLEVQSLSKTILEQILAECFDSLDSTTYTFWTEKFNDLCAGCYVTFSVTLPKELICADDDLFKKVVKEINENGTYNVQTVDEVVVDVPQAPCKLQELSDTIKVNHTTQTYYPQDGYDGIEKMTVNVEVPEPKLQMKQVTLTSSAPLSVNPDEGYDGIKQLNINQNLQIKSITANGTYRPDAGYNGISDVMVNVEVPEPMTVELNTTISKNNENLYFNPEDYDADYFSQANIEVAIPTESGRKETYTSNGTYKITPKEGTDYLDNATVTVDVNPELETLNKTITSNATWHYITEKYGFDEAYITVKVPQTKVESEKTVTIEENDTDTYVTPSEGYDALQSVKVTTSIPIQDELATTIDTNGTYEVFPDEDYVATKKIDITVEVPNTTQEKEVTYTENGSYEVLPDTGNVGMHKVAINVDVPQTEITTLNGTITGNGNYTWNAKEGTAYNKVIITADVPNRTQSGTANLSDSLFVDTTTLTPTAPYAFSKVTLNNDLGLTIEDQESIDLGGVELNLTELLGFSPDTTQGDEWIIYLQTGGQPVTDTEATVLRGGDNLFYLKWNETNGIYYLGEGTEAEIPAQSPFELEFNLTTGAYICGDVGDVEARSDSFAPFIINYQGAASELYFNLLRIECNGENMCSLIPKKITVANATYDAIYDEVSGKFIYTKVLKPKQLLPFTIKNLDVYDNIKEIDYNDYPIDNSIIPRYMVGETKLQKVTLGKLAPTTLQSLCWNNANYLTWLDATELDCTNVKSCNGAIGIKHTKLTTVIGDHTLEEVEAGKIVAFKNLGTLDLDYYQLEGSALRYASLLAIVKGLADRTGKTQQAFRISQVAYNKCLNDDGSAPDSATLTARQNTLVTILTEKNYSIEYKS